jgi:hypothetical protein
MKAKKPSDLSPLFSDEDATPQEIAKARRLVAAAELQKATQEYHRLQYDIDYTTMASSPVWKELKKLEKRIVELALELFPDERFPA